MNYISTQKYMLVDGFQLGLNIFAQLLFFHYGLHLQMLHVNVGDAW